MPSPRRRGVAALVVAFASILILAPSGAVADTVDPTPISAPAPTPNSIAISPDGDTLYVGGWTNKLWVFDTSDNSLSETVELSGQPTSMDISPDGSRLYVTMGFASAVEVVDTSDNSVIATVPLWPGGFSASGIAVTPDGSHVYVANQANASNSVSVIRTSDNTVVAEIPTGGVHPTSVAISPDGAHAYVTNLTSGTVSVIDTGTNTVSDIIAVDSAFDIAVSPDGSRVYVSQFDEHALSIIDSATNVIVSTVAMSGNPYAIAVTPDGSRVYVNDFNGGVVVVDTATNTIVETLDVGDGQKWDIAISRDGSTAYVVQNNTVNQVSIIHIEAPPAITTPTLPDGVVGTPYAETITATGFPAPSFALDVPETLPPGLTLGADGQLLGEPTAAGEYDFSITATNEHGTATQGYTITIEAPPVITTITLPDGVVDDGYLANIVATGTLPLTFTLDVPGTLPPGLGLTANGQVSGTPDIPGDYTFSVTATNVHGSDVRSYTVSVGESPALVASPLPDGVVGTAYSASIAATGSPTPSYAVTGGSLPPGLDLAGDGHLTGTPDTAGDYDFTITVTNVHGADTNDYTIHIAARPAGLADTGSGNTIVLAIMALLTLALGTLGVARGIRRLRATR